LPQKGHAAAPTTYATTEYPEIKITMHRNLGSLVPFNVEDHLEEVASEWVARHDRKLTQSEAKEFETWINSNPRHAEAYKRISASWNSLEQTRCFQKLHELADAVVEKSRQRKTVPRYSGQRRNIDVSLGLAGTLTHYLLEDKK
jgi:ferric-dicitrate binding protein FerR (iron transport regulator)